MTGNVVFFHRNTQEIFNDLDLMRKKIGNEMTRTIKKRLDQLKAAKNFSIYLTTALGMPEPLTENLKGYYRVKITGNMRLIVRPDTQNLEPLVLKECETVIIRGVLDYHGKKNEWLIA